MSGLLYTSQRFSCTPALRMLLCGKYIALSSLIESVVGFIVITKIMKIFQLAGLLDFRSVAASAAPFGAVAFVFLLFGRGEGDQLFGITQGGAGCEDHTCPFHVGLGERLLVACAVAGQREAEITELA